MPKLSTLKESPIVHAIIYGPPKAGKTQLVGTLAEEFKLHWFDLEKGHGTLFHSVKPEHMDNITLFDIPDHRGYPMGIETMLKVIKGGDCHICVEHGKVNCPMCWDVKEKKWKDGKEGDSINVSSFGTQDILVVDSLTQLTNSAIANITKGKPDDYKLNYDDWGNLGKVLDTFLSYVQTAPFHVICISHESPVEMNDGKEKLVPTAGTRNFSRNAAKYFGEVIYAEVKNKKHQAASSTSFMNNILTGSRTGTRLEDMTTGVDLKAMFRGGKLQWLK